MQDAEPYFGFYCLIGPMIFSHRFNFIVNTAVQFDGLCHRQSKPLVKSDRLDLGLDNELSLWRGLASTSLH